MPKLSPIARDEWDQRPVAEIVTEARRRHQHVPFAQLDELDTVDPTDPTGYYRHVDTGTEYRTVHQITAFGPGEDEYLLTHSAAILTTIGAGGVLVLEPVDPADTLAARQERYAAQLEVRRERRAAEHATRVASSRPVDVCALHGFATLTVREAAELVIGAGGVIEPRKGGRIIVNVPNVSGWRPASLVLYAVAELVADAARAGKLDQLPDQPVTPAGSLI